MKTAYFFLITGMLFACRHSTAEIPNVWVNADTATALRFENGLLWHGYKRFSGHIVAYFPSKKRRLEETWLNGKAEGLHLKWYENGQRQEQRTYVNNHKHGLHLGWRPGGKRQFEYHFADDAAVGTHREWYANGQLFTVLTYNPQGQPEGVQQMWYNTGQIKANYIVKNGRRFGLLGAKGCMGENERERTKL